MSVAKNDRVIDWLLAGDPAIRWQAMRDLTGRPKRIWERERNRLVTVGWGARLLRKQDPAGTWGGGLYNPKWISTTYTLLLLADLGISPKNPAVVPACRMILDKGLRPDGGIDLSTRTRQSEVCITGMALRLACAFGVRHDGVERILDYLFAEQMDDGAWNCQHYRGATHSSFHTTISVLEGLWEYVRAGGARSGAVEASMAKGREFLLRHSLYRSHRTGSVVDSAYTRFSFPPRWHYDVLRGLVHFASVGAAYDKRLEDPIGVVIKRRQPDGRWLLQNVHRGRTYFDMEKLGQPSRWNTLRALTVLKWWNRVRPKT